MSTEQGLLTRIKNGITFFEAFVGPNGKYDSKQVKRWFPVFIKLVKRLVEILESGGVTNDDELYEFARRLFGYAAKGGRHGGH